MDRKEFQRRLRRLVELAMRTGALRSGVEYVIRTGSHIPAHQAGVTKKVALRHPEGALVRYSHKGGARAEMDLVSVPEDLRGTAKGSASLKSVGNAAFDHLQKNKVTVSFMPVAMARDRGPGVVTNSGRLAQAYKRMALRKGWTVNEGLMTHLHPPQERPVRR